MKTPKKENLKKFKKKRKKSCLFYFMYIFIPIQ